MKKTYIFLIFMVTIFFIVSCIRFGKSNPLKSVRFEGIPISKISINNKPMENIRAILDGSEILVLYDTTDTKTKEKETVEISFHNQDGTRYINDKGSYGRINSFYNSRPLSNDEISKLTDEQQRKLIFTVFEENRKDVYYNMVYIKGGTFNMGSRKTLDEIPVHRITVNDFYMDKYEVTVIEYLKFCHATKRRPPQQPRWNKDTHPIINVSWRDANAYAKWSGKRLPTEAEWEYAARSGKKNNWFAWGNVKPNKKRGDNIADESVRTEYRSWNYWQGYYDGFVFTSPVGSFLPNEIGLHDMGGNVKEWCADWYDKTFYKKSPRLNPTGPSKGSRRILRGGSWNYGPGDVRLTKRYRYKNTLKLNYIGFRCVKDVE
ncbi:MAG: formylglycine-generating enzyme family protein [Calditrichia bacterium]|nr:formylglycine-generating enzyme family protein [Calditrichia bacterium]